MSSMAYCFNFFLETCISDKKRGICLYLSVFYSNTVCKMALTLSLHRYGDRGRERPLGPPGYGRDPPGYGRDEGPPPQRKMNREEQIRDLSEQLRALETNYKVIWHDFV